jgi:hypothetical protein
MKAIEMQNARMVERLGSILGAPVLRWVLHGHDHAHALSGRLPVSDLKSFWGALACACWAV